MCPIDPKAITGGHRLGHADGDHPAPTRWVGDRAAFENRGQGTPQNEIGQYNHIGLPGRGGSRQAIPSCDPTAAAPVAFEQCNYCGLNWPFWISLVTAASHRVVASHS